MNKIIWIFWFQGWQQPPYLCAKCLESWERLNPTWEIRRLDEGNLQRYVDLPDLTGKHVIHSHFADILRILLLKKYGGVWVDATLFCNKPLDDWLSPYLNQGFFAFAKPSPDRALSSWFLASAEQNYLVEKWHSETLAYWAERRDPHHYFWFHYLFSDLIEADRQFNDIWGRVPEFRADKPHLIQRLGMFNPATPAAIDQIDWETPVFKLSRKFENNDLENSLVWHLLEKRGAAASQDNPSTRQPSARPRVTMRQPWTRSISAAWKSFFSGRRHPYIKKENAISLMRHYLSAGKAVIKGIYRKPG